MIRMNHTLTALAAGLVLSGSALAAGPAAGEGPFFQFDSLPVASQLQRAEVRAQAAHEAPLAGELPAAPLQLATGVLTREQVRKVLEACEGLDSGQPRARAYPQIVIDVTPDLDQRDREGGGDTQVEIRVR